MRTSKIRSLLALSTLSLSLAACGGPVDPPVNQGDPDDDDTREALSVPLCRWLAGSTAPSSLSQDDMQRYYYNINPTPHSEKAYQVPPDTTPPIAVYPTYADANGCITVLDTFVYNKEGTAGVALGTLSAFAIHSPRGTVICQDSASIRYRQNICGLVPGRAYYIQPLTPNTQAKLLPKNLVPATP